jgi:hypothetical protein
MEPSSGDSRVNPRNRYPRIWVLEVSEARAGLNVFGSDRISIERWPPVTGSLGASCTEETAPREQAEKRMAIKKTKAVLLKKDGQNTITF